MRSIIIFTYYYFDSYVGMHHTTDEMFEIYHELYMFYFDVILFRLPISVNLTVYSNVINMYVYISIYNLTHLANKLYYVLELAQH